MATRIIWRRDIGADWTINNPILLDGEIGLESDTRKLKLGDGVTDWVNLPYITGVTGQAINLKGTVPTYNDLPTVNIVVGDAYITEDTGHLFIWNGEEWVDCGEFRGPSGDQGDPGDPGKEVELRSNSTHIQWRYVGDPTWIDLVAFSSIISSTTIVESYQSGTTLVADNSKLILVNSQTEPININLPNIESSAYSQFNGIQFTIKDERGFSESNYIQVNPQGTNTIDGVQQSIRLEYNFIAYTFTFFNGSWILT